MTLMQRRRALMAARKNQVIFEWDFTDGLSRINSVGSVSPTMEDDGLLMQGGTSAYSACAIAPSIPDLQTSYRAEITYKDLTMGGRYSFVGFWHYNDSRKRVNYGMFKPVANVPSGRIQFPDGSTSFDIFTPALYGTITIEYNKETSEITFSQGQNTKTVLLTGVTEWTQSARLVNAQTGEVTGTTKVKLLHIKIERI